MADDNDSDENNSKVASISGMQISGTLLSEVMSGTRATRPRGPAIWRNSESCDGAAPGEGVACARPRARAAQRSPAPRMDTGISAAKMARQTGFTPHSLGAAVNELVGRGLDWPADHSGTHCRRSSSQTSQQADSASRNGLALLVFIPFRASQACPQFELAVGPGHGAGWRRACASRRPMSITSSRRSASRRKPSGRHGR